MKNSTMILQAIQNNPKDLDAYRAYADALIEEGDELRGKFITANLGKYLPIFNVLKCTEEQWQGLGFSQPNYRIGLLHEALGIVVENGLIAHMRLELKDFMENTEGWFKQHPIQSVHLCDRYPGFSEEKGKAYWQTGSTDPKSAFYIYSAAYYNSSCLPAELTSHLLTSFDWPLFSTNRFYSSPTVIGSLQDLSVACVKLGRKKAGLPALTGDAYRELQLKQNEISGYWRCAEFTDSAVVSTPNRQVNAFAALREESK